ncbi:hypothetical protein F5884DRAFT_205117 [Xylogone sp. PMI_703]|nr:hypothetical protein F5884DRAFT_205117 [Xylogone sp. PMI_703]
MDEFAQSREDDDLFADDFEPADEPTVVQEAIAPVRAPAPDPEPAVSNSRGRGNHERGRGPRRGGLGRGGRGGNQGLKTSRFANNDTATTPEGTTEAIKPSDEPSQTSSSEATATESAPDAQPPTQPTEPTESTAKSPQAARTPAVRGDRSTTGGIMPKKLTEEELEAKMAAMAILNAQKAERHRLSEADSAAFQHMEKEMAKKRAEEQKNARAMDMERAKNRQRKLAAQGGREWDSEKTENDVVDGKSRGRSSMYVRGGHGGVIRGGGGLTSSRFGGDDGAESSLVQDNRSSEYHRGRGGMRGRGRGRGRGVDNGNGNGHHHGNGNHKTNPQTLPVLQSTEDFPALPGSKSAASHPGVASSGPPTGPGGDLVAAAGDWAEEMATPIDDKQLA